MDALAATQKFEIFGTTRKGVSEKLASKGVKAIKFKYGDAAAAENALKESGADMVWFVTLMGSRATEAKHGIIIVDACKKAGVKFVVFTSVADADRVIPFSQAALS